MTTMEPAALIFPQKRVDPFKPPRYGDGTAEMRRCVAYGGTAWLVTGFHATRAIPADINSFSADSTRPDFPALPLASKRPVPGHFLTMDPPEHTRLRQLVAAEFSPGRVRRLRSHMTSAVASLVDDLVAGGGPVDLVATVAMPLPAVTASGMLGTPVSDLDFFLSVARQLQLHDATPTQRAAAAGRMNRYLERVIVQMRGTSGTHLLSVLARAVEDGQATLAEAVGVANLIIIAGLETTAGLVGLTMLSLLADNKQADLVRADPQRWVGPAVAEALRYWTVVQHGIARVAVRDVEVAGCQVRQGDALIISLASANRDGTVFDRPDNYDITRNARQQLAFGHGIHRCLGSFVAQAQTELAVAELLTRLAGLRLTAPATELTFLDEMLIYGLRTLPVTW